MERIPQLLSDYFDGQLTAAEAEELAQHLRQDPQLRAEFVELYQLHRVLAMELRPPAEESFQAAVFAELRRDREEFVGSVMRRLGTGDLDGEPAPGLPRTQAADWKPLVPRLATRPWFAQLFRPAWAVLAPALALALVIVAILELKPEPVHAWVREINGPVVVRRGDQVIPAREGFAVRRGDALETPAEATAVLQYRDEATRVDLKPDSSLRVVRSRKGKRLELLKGRVVAQVAPQPKDRPMIVLTRQAEARVLGTRFSLAAKPASTWLEVTEGKVELCRRADHQSVQVGPGECTVAATGLELASRSLGADTWGELPVAVRIAWFSEYPEDEDWITTPGFVQQRQTYGDSFHPYRAPPLEGSVLLEVLVRVDELAPGAAGNGEGWGFGIGVRCAGEPSALSLRSLQRGPRGSVLEFSDLSARHLASVPLEHAPGWYQLKLRLDRVPDGPGRLQGKLWRQFEPEPESWMVTGELPGAGPLTAISLSTHNCACTFAQLFLSFIE